MCIVHRINWKCYYSIIAYIFFDLNANFVQFSVAECLDYIAYCAFRCNGTVLIAEIHRRIMSDPFRYDIMHSDSGSMYQFLIAVNKEITSLSPGSCTQNRFNFSQGSNDTQWNMKRKELLDLCHEFYRIPNITSRQSYIDNVASKVLHTLVTSNVFHGVGGMGANQFLHLTAMLGLIPLCCYNYAEVKKPNSGPGKLIQTAFPEKKKIKQIQECFSNVHNELRSVWGPSITTALLENKCCEVSRCLKATMSKLSSKRKRSPVPPPTMDCITDPTVKITESPKKDLIFFDEKKKRIQNFFRVVTQCKKSTPLRPVLVMKDANKWEEQSSLWQHKLTNWNQNSDDNKMTYWSEIGDNMTLDTMLQTTHDFDMLFI